MTYTVAGACGSSSTQTVTVTTPATAGFSYATPGIGGACAGSTGTFAPALATGATAGTFSSTTGLALNATTGVISLAGSTAGTYAITNTVAASGGCAAVSSTSTFTINATPATPTLTVTGTPSTGLVLTSSAATGNQFYLNGTAIAGATGQTYVVNSGTRNGSYTVVVTSTGGCASASSAPVSVTVTATASAQSAATVRLYPNPTPDGQLSVELSGYRKAATLSVVNTLGQVVRQLPAQAGNGTTQVDLSELANGVYLLRVSAPDQGLQTLRFAKY